MKRIIDVQILNMNYRWLHMSLCRQHLAQSYLLEAFFLIPRFLINSSDHHAAVNHPAYCPSMAKQLFR